MVGHSGVQANAIPCYDSNCQGARGGGGVLSKLLPFFFTPIANNCGKGDLRFTASTSPQERGTPIQLCVPNAVRNPQDIRCIQSSTPKFGYICSKARISPVRGPNPRIDSTMYTFLRLLSYPTLPTSFGGWCICQLELMVGKTYLVVAERGFAGHAVFPHADVAGDATTYITPRRL